MLVKDKIYPVGLSVQGQFGFTAGVGMLRCGRSRCGADKDLGGTYTRVRTLKGWDIARRRYYRPANPQTVKQQAWRAKLAAGWPVYNSLTTEQKHALMVEARKYRLSGPTLFMSRYLQAQR